MNQHPKSDKLYSGIFKNHRRLPMLRIDDRLIHGQVIVGWGQRLGIHRMVLAHNASVEDEAIRQLYNSIIPPEIEGSVRTLDDTIEYFQNTDIKGKTLIIVESPRDALYLLKNGLEVESVNVGGLHYSAGCEELLSYVFIDKTRQSELLEIIGAGVKVFCQDLPDNPHLNLTEKTLNLKF